MQATDTTLAEAIANAEYFQAQRARAETEHVHSLNPRTGLCTLCGRHEDGSSHGVDDADTHYSRLYGF